MKLFVWSNPYSVSYGSSLAFAIADSVEQARSILADSSKAVAYKYNEYDQDRLPEIELNGDPLRVVKLPCGEWHEWSE